MKKLLVLAIGLALVPVFVPANAHALTLAQRVTRVEAKLNCLTRTPVFEYAGYAWYGTDGSGVPQNGLNGVNTYDTQSPTDSPASDNPDSLTDQGWNWALDWFFPPSGQPQSPPDYWVMTIKTSPTTNLPLSGCVARFAKTPTPTWWGRTVAHRMQLGQLARVQ
jgi:hypothetical protein